MRPTADIGAKMKALDDYCRNLIASFQQTVKKVKESNDPDLLEKTINKFHKIQEQLNDATISHKDHLGNFNIPDLGEKEEFHALVSSHLDDREVAADVCEYLEEKNFKVFDTQWNVEPGESDFEAIKKAMRKSRKKVLLITPTFRDEGFNKMSYQVAEFVQNMIDSDKANFIPVFVGVEETDVPACISGIHGIYASEDGWKDRLAESLCSEFLVTVLACSHNSLAGHAVDSPLDSLIPAGDVGNGLAWSYYYGYLNFTLPEIHLRAGAFFERQLRDPTIQERFRAKGIPADRPFLKKFVCILSCTAACPETLKDEDGNITTIGNEEFEKDQAGNEARSYRTSVHYVKHPEKEDKGYFFMGEFCTPLLSMYRMEAGKIAGLSPAERQKQTNIFHKKIKEIMHHPNAAACLPNFVHVPYRDVTTKDGEKQKLSKLLCETIKSELKRDKCDKETPMEQ